MKEKEKEEKKKSRREESESPLFMDDASKVASNLLPPLSASKTISDMEKFAFAPTLDSIGSLPPFSASKIISDMEEYAFAPTLDITGKISISVFINTPSDEDLLKIIAAVNTIPFQGRAPPVTKDIRTGKKGETMRHYRQISPYQK